MKLVLRTDLAGVGHRGDVIDVADGYGRNYLVPKGLAVPATAGIEAQAAAMRRSRDLRDSQAREAAEEIATKLVTTPITITAHASGEGRLFGSVSNVDVSDAVKAQTGIEIDRKQVMLDEHIKDVGSHTVMVKLHSDVQFPVTVEVVAG